MSDSRYEYLTPDLMHYKKAKPKTKHDACIKCGKPFIGFKKQEKCFSCRLKEEREEYNHVHCSKCGRRSKLLHFYAKENRLLCGFCRHEKAQEVYMNRNYPQSTLISKVCPICKQPFETNNSVRVYCSEVCKAKRNNEKVRAYYNKHKTLEPKCT
jgi:hypothetical protein